MGRVHIERKVDKFERIHVFDPGGTTGYARVRIDYDLREFHVEELGEFPTWTELTRIISNLDNKKECVVYESFTARTLAANLIPVEVIGVIRYLCGEYKVFHFNQPPITQSLKSHGSGAIVNGWYPPLIQFTSHHGSAIRHAIFFCVDKLAGKQRWKLVMDYKKLMDEMFHY